MVHLLERRHGERFQALMESAMPSWRLHRDELNSGPLAHENWNWRLT
ncbi:MAG: YgjP-like metallopeptidase domain-containing protein [Trueperaceae bacterium]